MRCHDLIFTAIIPIFILGVLLFLYIVIFIKTFDDPLSSKFDINDYNNLTRSKLNSSFLSNIYYPGIYCKCGDLLNNGICSEEQIISGCFNLNSKKSNILNLLTSSEGNEFCKKYEDKMVDAKKVSDIFDIKSDKVNSMALGNLIIFGIILIIDILYLFSFILNCDDTNDKLGFLLLFVALVSEVINLVLSIIMIVYFYKGDTKDYIKFCEDCTINENQYNYLYVKSLDSLEGYIIGAFCIICTLFILYIIGGCFLLYVIGNLHD